MRLSLLLALAAVGACATAPTGTVPAPGGTAVQADTAGVSVIREAGGGAVVTVALRGPAAVSASHALRVETPAGPFEGPIAGTPRRTAEGGATVSTADYRLSEAGVRALDAAGGRARVSVHDGHAYRTYAVRRTDTVE